MPPNFFSWCGQRWRHLTWSLWRLVTLRSSAKSSNVAKLNTSSAWNSSALFSTKLLSPLQRSSIRTFLEKRRSVKHFTQPRPSFNSNLKSKRQIYSLFCSPMAKIVTITVTLSRVTKMARYSVNRSISMLGTFPSVIFRTSTTRRLCSASSTVSKRAIEWTSFSVWVDWVRHPWLKQLCSSWWSESTLTAAIYFSHPNRRVTAICSARICGWRSKRTTAYLTM